MGLIAMLEFQTTLTRLVETYVSPAKSDYLAY